MKITKTKIEGLLLIDLEPRRDDRGSLERFFCLKEFADNGIDFNLVQAYQSVSKFKHTLRGLHYQKDPKAEDKIIQCLRGLIYDVAVDLRQDSPTYQQWVAQELSGESRKLFLVPKGFAHGYLTLTEDCLVQCLASEFYSPEHEAGVRWNDPFFNIQWPTINPILSEKDKNWLLTSK